MTTNLFAFESTLNSQEIPLRFVNVQRQRNDRQTSASIHRWYPYSYGNSHFCTSRYQEQQHQKQNLTLIVKKSSFSKNLRNMVANWKERHFLREEVVTSKYLALVSAGLPLDADLMIRRKMISKPLTLTLPFLVTIPSILRNSIESGCHSLNIVSLQKFSEL